MSVRKLAELVKQVDHVYAPTASAAHDPAPNVVERVVREAGAIPVGTTVDDVLRRTLPPGAQLHQASETHRRLIRAVLSRTATVSGLVPRTPNAALAGILGVGLVGFAALYFFRKKVTAVAEDLLDRARSSPLTPTVPYAALPPGPPEVGPLAPNRSLGALQPVFQPRVAGLSTDLKRLLAPVGVSVLIAETLRTDLRQIFLYGIGRVYTAPGRTGTVTNATEVNGPHPRGQAVDFAFLRGGRLVQGAELKALLSPFVADLESTYSVRWGGHFSNIDPPHFEAAEFHA